MAPRFESVCYVPNALRQSYQLGCSALSLVSYTPLARFFGPAKNSGAQRLRDKK